jgi:hypothetical protein
MTSKSLKADQIAGFEASLPAGGAGAAWHGMVHLRLARCERDLGTEPPPLFLKHWRFPMPTEKALEARARRTARRVGLIAGKTRWRRDSIDNFGGFMLIEPYRNCVVAGQRFNMSAEEVIAFCKADQ